MKTKILFAGNKFIGSNLRISRLINDNINYKILSYYKYSDSLKKIDWNLQALEPSAINFFNNKHAPKCNKYYIELLLDEINSWAPNLIISDLEPISAYIAKSLNIPLWYVSPLVSLYDNHLKLPGYLKLFQNKIKKYPKANKYIIYYPIIISNNFDHVITKYEKCDQNVLTNSYKIKQKLNNLLSIINNDFVLTSGETDFISDTLFNNRKNYIMSKNHDLESMFNCYILDRIGVAIHIGNINSSNIFINNNINKNIYNNFTLVSKKFEDICT